jgi:hypothetical protein
MRSICRILVAVKDPKSRPLPAVAKAAQLARETHSSIVVMGALSRSGLKRFLIGNTAEGVLDYLPCDILILKPQAFVTQVQSKARGIRYNVSPVMQGLY